VDPEARLLRCLADLGGFFGPAHRLHLDCFEARVARDDEPFAVGQLLREHRNQNCFPEPIWRLPFQSTKRTVGTQGGRERTGADRHEEGAAVLHHCFLRPADRPAGICALPAASRPSDTRPPACRERITPAYRPSAG
jgi:hypothetical protein